MITIQWFHLINSIEERYRAISCKRDSVVVHCTSVLEEDFKPIRVTLGLARPSGQYPRTASSQVLIVY